MRFLHIADVHLGNQQYNLKERFNDFGRAFEDMVTLALDKGVDALVIAGDLFHKAAVEPLTLLQAEDGLQRLHDAGVPVIAVHGNHDSARYMAQMSWLDYLGERGLIHLLTPQFERSGVVLLPWDDREKQGAYLDIGHIRFVGVPWLGASAPHVLGEIAQKLPALSADGITFTVLVTHAGVEGQMPHMPGGLKFSEINPLKDVVQYVALGHLHKPYAVDDWIYNPGSLETCGFDEAEYRRGAYLVEVSEEGSHRAEHLVNVRRLFLSVTVDVDLCSTPEALYDLVQAMVQEARRKYEADLRAIPDPERRKPVVRLILRGNLAFDRSQLELEKVRQVLLNEFEPLHGRVDDRTTLLGLAVEKDSNLTRDELERLVFAELIRRDPRFRGHEDEMTALLLEVKKQALDKVEPATIYALLDTHLHWMEEGSDVDH